MFPLSYHHCTITAPSLHHHRTITAPSLHHEVTSWVGFTIVVNFQPAACLFACVVVDHDKIIVGTDGAVMVQ